MQNNTQIVWLRDDLRLRDNTALYRASERGGAVVVVFVLEPAHRWSRGAASRYWLHHSLKQLDTALRKAGNQLVLRCGDAADELATMVAVTGATAVHFNKRYDPHGRRVDAGVVNTLGSHCELVAHNDRLLVEPSELATAGGTPYKVFTPFYRALLRSMLVAEPLPAPRRLTPAPAAIASESLEAMKLLPQIDWAEGIRERWSFGENGAWARYEQFEQGALKHYSEARDVPADEATSLLSPHLANGEISVRSVWYVLEQLEAQTDCAALSAQISAFRRQLVWREFATHLLFHFPETSDKPLRSEFAALEWRHAPQDFAAWCAGKTGFPLIDAGLRELWRSGYMHNRVRMIVASFLCKHLGIHWLEGARWFWDTLVDADLANNTLGWQWVAGCGADAAPYFRVFNPVTQSRKFDPAGDYIRHNVRELDVALVNDIHAPGCNAYAEPLVDLKAGREAALARYAGMKAGKAQV